MEQIKFKTGVFQEFMATRSFAMGATNVTVAKGSELEFDGSTVRYGGATHSFPQLRGAVSSAWLVPTAEYDSDNSSYGQPVSANIKMRPPTDSGAPAKAMVTLETDERVVMSSADHAANTRDQNRSRSAPTTRRAGAADSQDGVEVRTLKTAAGSRAMNTRTVLTAESAGSALRDAESVQIKPGRGLSQDEMLSRMDPEERESYLASKASIKSRYVDDDAPETVTVGKVVTAKVREAEGMKLTQQVGGGVEIADMGGVGGGKAKASTVTEDGITFKNTNGPENKPKPHHRAEQAGINNAAARLQVAKALCPEFPVSYDFSAPERKKLARLQADFEDRPDILRAVFAAETDSFKARLVEEFPQAFG